MSVLDPRAIRAAASEKLGPLVDAPATWGVLPEGIVVETADRAKHRLARSEPCLFLGPPRRSKLLIACAILDPSEIAEEPVRLFAFVNVAELAGLWPVGLEDAVARFPAGSVTRERPEVLALPAGTIVWRLGEVDPEKKTPVATALPRALAAVAVGRETATGRRAVVLVRAVKALDAAYFEERAPSAPGAQKLG